MPISTDPRLEFSFVCFFPTILKSKQPERIVRLLILCMHLIMNIFKTLSGRPRWHLLRNEALELNDSHSFLPGPFDIRTHRSSALPKILLTGFHLSIFLASVVFFFLSRQRTVDQNASVRATSWYSKLVSFPISPPNFLRQAFPEIRLTNEKGPVVEDIELPFHDTQFNGSLFPGKNPSVWRMKPGQQLDAAFEPMEKIKVFPITKEQVIKLGKDPSTVAMFDDSYWHMGDNAYMGSLDAQHQVHCLNLLRTKAFADFDGRVPPPYSPYEWTHLSHCTDILMQNLLCYADPGIVTYTWTQTQKHPFPDFNINRKCRAFETVLGWAERRAVDEDEFRAYRRPHGTKEMPMDPGYFEMFGYKLVDHHVH